MPPEGIPLKKPGKRLAELLDRYQISEECDRLLSEISDARAKNMSEYMNEPHEFVEDCDCRDCAIAARDMAIRMLAEWCAAIDRNGAYWDSWNEYYRNAAFRHGALRRRLDKAIAEVNAQKASEGL